MMTEEIISLSLPLHVSLTTERDHICVVNGIWKVLFTQGFRGQPSRSHQRSGSYAAFLQAWAVTWLHHFTSLLSVLWMRKGWTVRVPRGWGLLHSWRPGLPSPGPSHHPSKEQGTWRAVGQHQPWTSGHQTPPWGWGWGISWVQE